MCNSLGVLSPNYVYASRLNRDNIIVAHEVEDKAFGRSYLADCKAKCETVFTLSQSANGVTVSKNATGYWNLNFRNGVVFQETLTLSMTFTSSSPAECVSLAAANERSTQVTVIVEDCADISYHPSVASGTYQRKMVPNSGSTNYDINVGKELSHLFINHCDYSCPLEH